MIEDEAHALAERIRTTGQQHLVVQEITNSASNGFYQIRCRYIGPTVKTEFHLFLHGMEFWIRAPYQWNLLKKSLESIP